MKYFRPHRAEVTALLYADAAKILISASWDKTVVMHDELEAEGGDTVIKEFTGYVVCG